MGPNLRSISSGRDWVLIGALHRGAVASLKDNVQTVLDECRMLILGGQVLIGFGSEAVLEPGFDELSGLGRALCVVAMVALTVGVALIMSPAAYHRIVLEGEDEPRLVEFASRVLCIGLAPFAVGLGAGVYVAGERGAGMGVGVVLGVGAGAAAMAAWYVWPLLTRRGGTRRWAMEKPEKSDAAGKIRHVLTEARMVLPGAQALLGFGTIAVLMEAYKALPAALKAVHLVSLCFIAAAVVLLMTPAAYHRIVERGEMDERFYRIASGLLLLGMAALAPGFAGSVWIVLEKGTGSRVAGVLGAAGILVLCYGFWFGRSLWVRGRRKAGAGANQGRADRK